MERSGKNGAGHTIRGGGIYTYYLLKKLVTMFLTLVLCVGVICVPASAYYTEVTEMTYVTPSNSSIGTTNLHPDGRGREDPYRLHLPCRHHV